MCSYAIESVKLNDKKLAKLLLSRMTQFTGKEDEMQICLIHMDTIDCLMRVVDI